MVHQPKKRKLILFGGEFQKIAQEQQNTKSKQMI